MKTLLKFIAVLVIIPVIIYLLVSFVLWDAYWWYSVEQEHKMWFRIISVIYTFGFIAINLLIGKPHNK